MQKPRRRVSGRDEIADRKPTTRGPRRKMVTTLENGFHVVVVPPDSPPVTPELIKELDAEQDLYKVSRSWRRGGTEP
jgi:molybdopterin-guanine dinucleotide biosynthesis protein A